MVAPQELVTVRVTVIAFPEVAFDGTVNVVFKLLETEKLPAVVDQETVAWPCAIPVKFKLCPGHALRGVFPASTVNG